MNNDTNRNYIIGGIIILLIIFIAVLWSLNGSGSGTVATSTTATTSTSGGTATGGVSAGAGQKVSATSIAQSSTVSTYIRKDSQNVYVYTDTDAGGNKEYSVIAGADPATFTALTQLADVEKPTEKDGSTVTALGNGSVAYYKDKNSIYVLSVFTNGAQVETGIEVVQNADVSTFKVMSTEYAKDKNQVYALQVPTDATPHATGTYTWAPYDMKAIPDAHSTSFVLSAGANFDAHDASSTYRGGIKVGNYPS